MAQRLQNRPVQKPQKSGSVGKWIKFIMMLYFGIQFLASGITTSVIIGPVGVPILIIGVLLIFFGIFSVVRKSNREKEKSEFSIAKRVTDLPRPTEKASFSFRGDHHQHIVVTGISVEKQLEQLDTLYHAGLYTKEQYLLEKQKIKSRG